MLKKAICFFLCCLCANAGELKFPDGFKLGVATAAFQIEGGWNASGKGENVWDQIAHNHPELIADHSNGDIACDSYHLWKTDVEILKSLNVDHYRFSLSWSRILPNGFSNFVNPDGIDYYNNLIDALIENGIEPMVTLYHWDLPVPLQNLGGWVNHDLADYFEDYARVVFDNFGDRVKSWITINEPNSICLGVFESDGLAPPFVSNPGISPYLCGKTILLAHARAYRLYQEKYKKYNGSIGLSIDASWHEPKTNETADVEATEREMQWGTGWWAHPIFSESGDYPEVMKTRIAARSKEDNFSNSRLPALTPEEVELIKGSADFIGINHYFTYAVADKEYNIEASSLDKDKGTEKSSDPNWEPSPTIVPWGIRKLMNWIKNEYGSPTIIVTENGSADSAPTNDNERILYLNEFMKAVLLSVLEDDCDVQGYTVWSIMDNMEWRGGYYPKFGLYSVNFTDPQRTRTPKLSADYFKNVIATRTVTFPDTQFVFFLCCLCANAGELKFPDGFKLGVATAAFQIEGGWNASGKGENIWDHLAHNYPDLIVDHSNGDIACDSYHLWRTDVEMLKSLNVDHYRFSLSWSRILPNGFSNFVNPDGIDYYNNLIDALIENGIEPMVTLYHWDLPVPLQKLGGWVNHDLADYFEDYARVVFDNFGDRVKYWITINEPNIICAWTFESDYAAPAFVANPGISLYLCGKTILLAHARAYRLYQDEYKEKYNGNVGITLDSNWYEPKTNESVDIEASEREMQFMTGWWGHPIFSESGDYPEVMKSRVDANSEAENFSGSRLPTLTPEEIELIKGTSDFFGLNHYHTYAIADKEQTGDGPSQAKDKGTERSTDPNWEPTPTIVPWGFRKLLNWIKNEYGSPVIIVTENGSRDTVPINDNERVLYLNEYMKAMLLAVHEDDCNIQGYTVWSLMDNMEWRGGYTVKLGLYFVNFTDPQRTRTPKLSADYFKNVIATRTITYPDTE